MNVDLAALAPQHCLKANDACLSWLQLLSRTTCGRLLSGGLNAAPAQNSQPAAAAAETPAMKHPRVGRWPLPTTAHVAGLPCLAPTIVPTVRPAPATARTTAMTPPVRTIKLCSQLEAAAAAATLM